MGRRVTREEVEQYYNHLIKNAKRTPEWAFQRIQDLTDDDPNKGSIAPDAFNAFKKQLDDERKRQAKEEYDKSEAAKSAAFEAKVGRGTAPQEAPPADVVSRLERMGIDTDQMKDALDAYENAFDAYKDNKNLTLDEFKKDLTVRGYHENQIEGMLKYVDLIDPIVKADLGYSSPNQVFPDAVSRRNYLIANHFSPEEIAKIDATKPTYHASAFTTTADGKTVNAPGYDLPEDAKKRIVQQYAKQARAAVKRSKEQEDKDFAIHETQKHNAQSVTGQISDATADQLRQTAANLAVKWYNDGAPEYKGDVWAETTEEEKEAEKILKSLAPGDSRREELERLKADAMKNRLSSDAAAPYMAKASRGLDEDYESRFAEKQEKDEQNLLDKMNKNYLEKIAPTIRQNYLTNNVTSHSRINEDMADTYKKLQEDNLKTVAANRIQNQMQHLKLLAEEKQKDAGLAAQAGDLAQKDLQTKLSAIGASEALNKTGENEHLGHMDRLGSLGEKKKSQKQAELDLKKQEFLDKADHIRKSAGFMSDVASGNFLYGVHEQTPSAFPKRNPGNWKSSTSRGMLNAGLRSEEKEGGRVHLAEGGEIDPQQAIDSAVTQGTTPSYEIGRLNNKYVTNAAGIGYLKARNAQKQAYAIGGNVNPIMEGASQAQAVADEDKRQQEEEDASRQRYDKIRQEMMRAPVEEEVSPLRKFIKNFMEGAATGEGNDWVSRAGQAYVATEKSNAEKAKAKSKAKGRHNDLVAKLMEQHQAEVNQRASRKLEERSYGLKEREYNEGKDLRQAELNKILAETGKLKSEYEEVGGSDSGTPPDKDNELSRPKVRVKPKDRAEALTKSDIQLDESEKYLRSLTDAVKSMRDANTGSAVGNLYGDSDKEDVGLWGGIKRYAAGKWAGADADKLNDINKKFKGVVESENAATNVLGAKEARQLAANLKLKMGVKASLGSSPQTNLELLERAAAFAKALSDIPIEMRNRYGDTPSRKGNASAEIANLKEELDREIAETKKHLSGNRSSEKKKSISHNVDYATGNSNNSNKSTLAELKKKEARLVKEINGGR